MDETIKKYQQIIRNLQMEGSNQKQLLNKLNRTVESKNKQINTLQKNSKILERKIENLTNKLNLLLEPVKTQQPANNKGTTTSIRKGRQKR